MTTGMKLHQTLAMLEQVKGNMHAFTLETTDPLAKQMYSNFHKQLEQITTDFQARLNYVQEQEPQYKLENMIQQKQDNMQQQ